jgi:Mce-associated membrane protein
MGEAKEPPQDSTRSKADTSALIAEAEAEAAEAEALAAAARARARAARLRREVQAAAEAEAAETTEEAPGADEDPTDTAQAKTDDDATESDVDENPTDTAEAETDDTVAASETDADSTDAGAAETTEEVSDETPEDAESESESARSRRHVRLPSLSVAWKAAAIILICAFVGASGYMMWQRQETVERNQRTANFLAGARQGVVNITSLDFKRAKEDVQRVIDSSTGQFRDDFQQRAKDFTTVVEQSKVVTEGTVNAAAVQSIDGNSALVLVAATSKITNAAGAKDEPRTWRLKVTVTEDGGQYKVSKLEFIP